MRKDSVEAALVKARDAANAADDLLVRLTTLQGAAGDSLFDISGQVPGRDSSVADVVARMHSISELLAGSAEQNFHLVPKPVLAAIEASADAFGAAVTSINNALNAATGQGGLASISRDSLVVISRNGHSQNLGPLFQALVDGADTFAEASFRFLSIVKVRGAASFQAASSRYADLLRTLGESLQKVRVSISESDKRLSELSTITDIAKSSQEEISRIKGSVELERKSIGEHLAETTQSRSTIQAIRDEARALEESVKSYQASFDQFSKTQSEREAALQSGNQKLNALMKALDEKEKKIDLLMAKSEGMLSATTIVGLASNFHKMTEKLTSELNSTRLWFFGGIVFLFISSIPLAAFVIMPMITPFLDIPPDRLAALSQIGPNGTKNGWQYFSQVIGRTTILLPAVWFVSFMVVRHSSLFKLREHYAYKYSMAVAVEGFKKEAPEYEQEIAAMVLEQLAFNPADKLSRRPADNEGSGRFAEHLMAKLRGRPSGGEAGS